MKSRNLARLSVLLLGLVLAAVTSYFYSRSEQPQRTEKQSTRYIAHAKPVKLALLDSGVHSQANVPLAGSLDFTKNERKSQNSKQREIRAHADVLAALILSETRKNQREGPRILLYSLKVLDDEGYGVPADLVRALEWCAHHRMDVVNISAGFRKSNAALEEAIGKVRERGAVVVAAAGNTYGLYTDFPAAYEQVLSVGALDLKGRTARYSATGKVDIYAPGHYGVQHGTSLASAYASARIAATFSRQEQLHHISKRINESIKKESNRI